MNLVQPPRRLTSPIPRTQDQLLTGNSHDFFQVLYWSLWSPPTLISYVEERLVEHTNQSTRYSNSQASFHPIFYLRLIALLTAIFIVLFICAVYTISVFVFNLSSPTPSAPMILLSFGLAVGVIILTYLLCRLFIEDVSLGMATILTLGLANGLLVGLIGLSSNAESAQFRAALIGICWGGTFGLLFSTFYYYFRGFPSKLVGYFFVLTSNFLAWAILFAIFIPKTVGNAAVVGLAGLIAFGFAYYRPDDWIYSILINRRTQAFNSFYFSQVSPLPDYTLGRNLLHWLDIQWDEVIPELPKFVAQKGQKHAVMKAIDQALTDLQQDKAKDLLQKSEQIFVFYANSDLLPKPEPQKRWSIKGSKRSPRNNIISLLRNPSSWISLPSSQKRKEYRHELYLRKGNENPVLEINSEQEDRLHASMRGFQYLEMEQPKAAKKAFEQAPASDRRSEMVAIADCLATLLDDEQISDNPPLKIPKKPDFPSRRATWDIFERLQKVVRTMWILRSCSEPESFQSVVKDLDDEFGELNGYLEEGANHADLAGLPEKRLLIRIVKEWEDEFIQFALSFGIWHEIRDQNLHSNLSRVKDSDLPPSVRSVTHETWEQFFREKCRSNPRTLTVKPVKTNPYAFEEPISAHNGIHVGRRDQLDHISSAWEVGNFQPVLLTGQRFSGKTSLIREADSKSGIKMDVAYINLRQFEGRFSVNRILLWIANAVSELTSFATVDLDRSVDDPEHAFQQFIHTCCSYTGNRGLVIVLDGFEYLELHMIDEVLDRLMHFLWALAETEPSLGIVFSTTSIEAEIKARYNSPFSDTLRAVEVGMLTKSEVEKLLQTPTPNFLPYVTDNTVNCVYELTNGQPFLTQLIAFHLVERFNSQAKERDCQRSPLITPEDLAYCRRPDTHFHRDCQRYYMGILREATAVHHSAEAILRTISDERHGMTKDHLDESLQMPIELRTLLLLEGHNIIRQLDNHWQISVELFREWLSRQRINP